MSPGLLELTPRAVQNAEHWPVDAAIVRPTSQGGAGFDCCQNEGLRIAIRSAIRQASLGADATVDLDRVAGELASPIVPEKWRAVNCVESHDLVYKDRHWRIPKLADPSNSRSWYATSRSRVAHGLLLTAPGIPHLFMEQEFLEDKQWSDDPASANLLYWQGLVDQVASGHKQMADFLRFTQELIALRKHLPGLRGEGINVFYRHNLDRVIAFHRWVPGEGAGVIVVASLAEQTRYDFRLGFTRDGFWREVFNSDVYEYWVNPHVAGNATGIHVNGPGLHGLPSAASVIIPANAVLVFSR